MHSHMAWNTNDHTIYIAPNFHDTILLWISWLDTQSQKFFSQKLEWSTVDVGSVGAITNCLSQKLTYTWFSTFSQNYWPRKFEAIRYLIRTTSRVLFGKFTNWEQKCALKFWWKKLPGGQKARGNRVSREDDCVHLPNDTLITNTKHELSVIGRCAKAQISAMTDWTKCIECQCRRCTTVTAWR